VISYKKLLVAVTGVTLLFVGPISAVHSAGVPDEQWNLPINGPGSDGAELIGLKIANAASGTDQPSYLVGDSIGNQNRTNELICNSLNDAPCQTAAKVFYSAYLPPCDASITINCIVGVSAIDPNGNEIKGIYQRNFPKAGSNDYSGNSSLNLPTGSSPSVWKIPGVVHGGGEDSYLLRFDVQGVANRGETFHSYSLQSTIFPITTTQGDFSAPSLTDANHPSGGCINDHNGCGQFGSQVRGNSDQLTAACVSFDVGLCALRQAFPSGYRFKVTALMGNSPTGWFHGRFANPLVDLTTGNGVTTLSVEASPVKVPVVGTLIKQADMTPAMKNYYKSGDLKGMYFGLLSPNRISNFLSMPAPSDSNVFEEYGLWSNYFKDTASANQSEWSFRTLELNGNDNFCFRDSTKLVGIVSTNAMIYSGGAPAFNKSEGSLDYKVGAPHFASNGDVFKGSYDLQLRSDVARCLYGFSNAPIKATVSIASDNGDSNVATTTVNEDKATGWVRMSASNFTFSNPTVKIKFTQDAPAKKITITCIKGKSTKTVTAVKPVCPSGYRRTK
jgi:hypothetical protein